MGALVAGVALSTFPYALDVTAKVISLRDFFVALFFCDRDANPAADWQSCWMGFGVRCVCCGDSGGDCFHAALPYASGIADEHYPGVEPLPGRGFSLVVLALGVQAGHLAGPATRGIVALAFTLLAVVSTFGMAKSDRLRRALIPWLKKLGLRDLDHVADDASTVAQLPATGLGLFSSAFFGLQVHFWKRSSGTILN